MTPHDRNEQKWGQRLQPHETHDDRSLQQHQPPQQPPQKGPFSQHKSVDGISICMDIPFVDHPYLIGPRGRKCQNLMERYRTLIHFPDFNRQYDGPKLNNVLINGSMKSAEEIRHQLRMRTPIRLAVQLHHFPDKKALMQRMESVINKRSLPIRLSCSADFNNAIMKTEWRNDDILAAFCDEFLGPSQALLHTNKEIYTLAENVLPLINPWNPEISHWLVEYIFEETGARVLYPPEESFSNQPPSYFVKSASVSGTLRAGKCLLGLTMFQVSFMMTRPYSLTRQQHEEWKRDMHVHVTIEPVCGTGGQISHEIAILSSFEFCINNVYTIRAILLGYNKSAHLSTYDFMMRARTYIPSSVFSSGCLFYPLYSVDDKSAFNWNVMGGDFIKYFYGGPSAFASPQKTKQRLVAAASQRSLMNSTTPMSSGSSARHPPHPRMDTSSRCMNTSMNKTMSSGVTIGTPTSIEVARASPIQPREEPTPPAPPQPQQRPIQPPPPQQQQQQQPKRQSKTGGQQPQNQAQTQPQPPVQTQVQVQAQNPKKSSHKRRTPPSQRGSSGRMSSSGNSLQALPAPHHPPPPPTPTFVPAPKQKPKQERLKGQQPRPSFHHSTSGVPSSEVAAAPTKLDFENCPPTKSISTVAASPSTTRPSTTSVSPDSPAQDAEIKELLRRMMPCLEVTEETTKNIDFKAVAVTVTTAEYYARMWDPSISLANFEDYSVSYPVLVSVEEFEKQFEAFDKARELVLIKRSLLRPTGTKMMHGRGGDGDPPMSTPTGWAKKKRPRKTSSL